VTLDGRVNLVSAGAKAAYGYDAGTGEELWKITYDQYSTAASPIFVGNMAIINTGYGKAHLLGVRLDDKLKGDVTRSHIEWDVFKRIPPMSSPIGVDGKVYTTSDLGILSRIDAASGKFEARLSLTGHFAASGVYADGHLYFASEEGDTKIVTPGADMKISATLPSPALKGRHNKAQGKHTVRSPGIPTIPSCALTGREKQSARPSRSRLPA
jgi:outer membrane protein assembly factor BamB